MAKNRRVKRVGLKARAPKSPVLDILNIRSQLINKGLIYYAGIIPLAASVSLARYFQHGWQSVYLLHIGLVTVIVAGAVYRNKLAYRTRAILLLGSLLLVGMAGTYSFGLVGGGILVLVIFSIITAVAFGTRAALIASFLSLVYVGIIGAAVIKGTIFFPFNFEDYATSVTAWTSISIIFLVYIPGTVAALGVFHENLATSLQDLNETHSFLNSIIDTVPDIIYRLDLEGNIVFMNEAIERYGYTVSELIGSSVINLIHPDDRPLLVNRLVERRAGNRRIKDLEIRLLSKNTEIVSDGVRSNLPEFLIDAMGLYVTDEAGDRNFIGSQGTIRDITSRKAIEAALDTSEGRYRDLYESTPAMLHSIDKQGKLLSVSNKWLEILGYERDEVLGRESLEFLTEESQKYAKEVVLPAFFENGHCFDVPYQMVRKNGEIIDVLISATSERAEDGSINRSFAVSEDITERKRTEAALRRFALVIEQTSEMVVITDTDGIITYVNPAFEETTGYSYDEAVGQNPRILKSDKTDISIYQDLWRTIGAGDIWHGQIVNKNKSGTLTTEKMTISPLRDESGDVISYVAVKRDITHELDLEAQFQQAQKMEAVGRLAGGVAHDFNNLLTAIIGHAELALMSMAKDDNIRCDIEEIVTTSERAAAVTRQLLAFSRKQVVNIQPIDVNDTIYLMSKMLNRLLTEDVQLSFDLGPDIGSVMADQSQIEQVILNLAVNARDAMPSGGKLQIQTEQIEMDESHLDLPDKSLAGTYLKLRVSDSGVGMPPEIQEHIFEPFFTTKDANTGTGLGLATIYAIVAQTGGHISVYSEQGLGTTFNIYIPVDKTSVVEKQVQTTPEIDPAGTETVLAVEDNDGIRNIIELILKQFGYTVITAADGNTAIEQFRAHEDIDIIVTDVVMPGLSGPEFIEQLQEANFNSPVLYMSGHNEDMIVDRGVLRAGINFISKPFHPTDLARKVREVLDANEQIEEA